LIDLQWLSEQLCDVLHWQLADHDPQHPDAPEVPWAGRRIWSIFLDLNATRTVGFAPNPISLVEIESWSRLRREPIRPFELEILQALDAAFLKAARVMSERKPEEPLGPPMTPSLFRAVFKGEAPKLAPSGRKFSIELFDAWTGNYEPPKKADPLHQ